MKKINSIGFMVSEVNYLFVMNSVSIAFFSKVVDNKQRWLHVVLINMSVNGGYKMNST